MLDVILCDMCLLYCILLCCVVWYCNVLYCTVLHCNTLPPGINTFAVNNNNNTNGTVPFSMTEERPLINLLPSLFIQI